MSTLGINTKLSLQQKAFGALIYAYKPQVVSILNKYGYGVSIGSSNLDIARALVDGVKSNSNLTKDVISLMSNIVASERKSGDDGSSSGPSADTSAIISAALQGIGMIDTTWTNTANISAKAEDNAAQIAANAQIGSTALTQSNVLTRGEKIGLVIGGVVLLGIVATVVIIVAKK